MSLNFSVTIDHDKQIDIPLTLQSFQQTEQNCCDPPLPSLSLSTFFWLSDKCRLFFG